MTPRFLKGILDAQAQMHNTGVSCNPSPCYDVVSQTMVQQDSFMHRLVIFAVLFGGFAAAEVRAQTTANPAAQKLAEEWLKRLNALADWHLSFDGKEDGLDQVVSSFMELLATDVIAELPPHDDEQIGLVMLRGSENSLSRAVPPHVSKKKVRVRPIQNFPAGIRTMPSEVTVWAAIVETAQTHQRRINNN